MTDKEARKICDIIQANELSITAPLVDSHPERTDFVLGISRYGDWLLIEWTV